MGSIPDGGKPIVALFRDLDDRATAKALGLLGDVEAEFRKLGLRITADTTKEIIDALKDTSIRRNFQWLMDQTKAVESLADKEFRWKDFFYVPPERAKFFPRADDQHIFGEAVARAFPSAIYDLSEAGTCLALARGSACVFHLMRILEVGLIALGKRFGVSLERTNWAPAIDQLESKIREMHKDPMWKSLPDCKEQQEFFAQAASHFGVLKDAWRNYTMHARGGYTPEQAERVFENVKGFMQKLATRLRE